MMHFKDASCFGLKNVFFFNFRMHSTFYSHFDCFQKGKFSRTLTIGNRVCSKRMYFIYSSARTKFCRCLNLRQNQNFSSARTKFCRCLNLRQNQYFLTPTFYHFSRRFGPPTTRFRKKNLVSVGLDLGFRFSVFGFRFSVFGFRFSVTNVTHHRNVV
jgi:hypothetical protein